MNEELEFFMRMEFAGYDINYRNLQLIKPVIEGDYYREAFEYLGTKYIMIDTERSYAWLRRTYNLNDKIEPFFVSYFLTPEAAHRANDTAHFQLSPRANKVLITSSFKFLFLDVDDNFIDYDDLFVRREVMRDE